MGVDEMRLEQIMTRLLSDLGAVVSVPLLIVGERLGLYSVLRESGPAGLAPAEIAARAGLAERPVQEWLMNQAAAGYIAFDPPTGKFRLTPEQRAVMADGETVACIAQAFGAASRLVADAPKIDQVFRTACPSQQPEALEVLRSASRLLRSAYAGHVVGEWVPFIAGMDPRLKDGGTVADVGCGRGACTVEMAKTYPQSRFIGFDVHPPLVEIAMRLAEEAGVARNCTFRVASATDFPGHDGSTEWNDGGYDLVCCFESLHDFADPQEAAVHIRRQLKADGAWMVVEPMAGESPQETLNPVGRVLYGAAAIGAGPLTNGPQPTRGESALRRVIVGAGFGRVRRAVDAPFHLVLEARP